MGSMGQSHDHLRYCTRVVARGQVKRYVGFLKCLFVKYYCTEHNSIHVYIIAESLQNFHLGKIVYSTYFRTVWCFNELQ